jgi:hypothetical protein
MDNATIFLRNIIKCENFASPLSSRKHVACPTVNVNAESNKANASIYVLIISHDDECFRIQDAVLFSYLPSIESKPPDDTMVNGRTQASIPQWNVSGRTSSIHHVQNSSQASAFSITCQ